MNIAVPTHTAHRIGTEAEALAVAQSLAADFAVDAVARDRDRRLPRREIEALSHAGLLAITVPRAQGGLGASSLTLARVIAILSAADPSIGQIPQNHFASLEKLRLRGSDAQKAFFYTRILAGERLGNANAEVGDKRPKDHETRLHGTPGDLRVSGRKRYATGALFAHWIPVSAIDAAGENVSVYVARTAPGLQVIDDWNGFGQRTTASGNVILDDVPVDDIQVFRNGLGKGAIDTSNAVSQLIHAAIDLGIARAAIDDTLTFLRERSHPARGSGVARAVDDPLTLRDIGALTVEYHAAEALTERAARFTDAGIASASEPDAAAALIAVAEAKILTTRIALEASSKLFELAGTQSTLAEHGLDRHWRNARTHTLHDGVRWKYHAVGQSVLNGLLCDPWTYGHPYSPAPQAIGADHE